MHASLAAYGFVVSFPVVVIDLSLWWCCWQTDDDVDNVGDDSKVEEGSGDFDVSLIFRQYSTVRLLCT